MNYLRELLYRPKRSDKSLIARFYFADLNLNAVAAELDSFDGRKDPERCSCLVNKLRSCQDKLLGICNKMLEEIEPIARRVLGGAHPLTEGIENDLREARKLRDAPSPPAA